jgi:hypothetical protein
LDYLDNSEAKDVQMKKASYATLVARLLLSLLLTALSGSRLWAQAPTSLTNLSIALWPEYDRPTVLVIYRGQVSEGTPLPARLSFNLPGSVEMVHALAYLDEGDQNLVNIPDYEFVEGDEGKTLSFASPSRQFQFEYYSEDMLQRSDDQRSLSFAFTPTADVSALSFELQQPTSAEDYSSEPAPSLTQIRQDGLTYALYDFGTAPAGETSSLQAAYTRTSDALSVAELGQVAAPIEQEPVEVGGGGLTENLGPILIAVGLLLLTAALGYWFWSQRAVVLPEPEQRQAASRSPRAARTSRTPGASRPAAASEEHLAVYCHRCGAKFREDARFCHLCGAERRAE